MNHVGKKEKGTYFLGFGLATTRMAAPTKKGTTLATCTCRGGSEGARFWSAM